ncbi:DUF4399 domain-containing protein [Natronomonas salina]|uniref:DUF4399 domain-containing protein n=1 Tax=Natronomonas salina TaxID=1710540 RepID=UPI0015B554A3|nr:DUF4399 domain-containing protein [Natronomonas salina]QLD87799.1 DUF4399 domain-containing protein [Natronomonas salina]
MPERVSRRKFAALAASTTAAAIAGCSDGEQDDDASGDQNGNGTAEGTGTPAEGEASIDVDEEASVSFEAPEDGATAANGVTVSMQAENFTIEEAGEVNDNAGHFHVMIDEGAVAVGEEIPNDETHLHFGDGSSRTVLDLEPGTHELTLQAADGQHRALDLTDTVEVEVEEASVSFAAPEDGATVQSPVAVGFDASENLQAEEAGELGQTGGHFHVMVDAEAVAVGEEIPNDDAHRHFGDGSTEAELELESGEHDLVLQMGDGEHLALPETDEISVTVE